jgi:hypothetical protein
MTTPPQGTDSGIIAQLQEAAEGLLYPSESDEPFTCFSWQGVRDITVEKLLIITHNKAGTPVEETTLHHFFEGVTNEADWMDEDEIEEARRFQNLKDALLDLLTDIRVFRLGAMDIDVYIVGKTPTGGCAGVQTKVVET